MYTSKEFANYSTSPLGFFQSNKRHNGQCLFVISGAHQIWLSSCWHQKSKPFYAYNTCASCDGDVLIARGLKHQTKDFHVKNVVPIVVIELAIHRHACFLQTNWKV